MSELRKIRRTLTYSSVVSPRNKPDPVEAEQINREALEIARAALGPEHPDTTSLIVNLALNVHAQGRYTESEQLNRTAIEINRALERYEFHTAVSTLYHFFWDDFCDWYIELKKDEITGGYAAASTRILTIIEIALRMLHPFMPYLTEELWHRLGGCEDKSISLAPFPQFDPARFDS